MRADEKINLDLDQTTEQEVVEELGQKEEPEQELAEEVDTSALRFHQLAAYIETLIAGNRDANLDFGWLSDVEQRGIELLAEAIAGRGYAEDRMVMLEQALAALQPVLAVGFESAEVDVNVYDALVGDLTELRAELASLADAQEEILAHDTMHLLGRADGKPGKPKPDAGEVGDDRPTTLAGPGPAVDKPVAPSTLAAGGPVAAEKPAAPSTLAAGGPAAPDKKPQPSAAWDGDEAARR